MMMSFFSATILGESAASAPRSTSSFTGLGSMSLTVRWYPAFSRFFYMGFPMIPRPMKPIFCCRFNFNSRLSERLTRIAYNHTWDYPTGNHFELPIAKQAEA